jgi:hypothetical protein
MVGGEAAPKAAPAQDRHNPACDACMKGVSFSITVILSCLLKELQYFRELEQMGTD